jgi:RNA polymerase sigma-70 factor (ECF subfamily)
VQETLLRAYRARGRFETGTSMRAWLGTILRRLFVTESMKHERRRTHPDSDLGELLSRAPGQPMAPSDPAHLSYDAALDQVPDRVRRAFVRLPETYREPFVLFALDGLSYAEIASHLSIPIGTVMSRIHRARSRLREKALATTTSELA